MNAALLSYLRCTACGSTLATQGEALAPQSEALAPEGEVLVCTSCARRVPVVGGIPRFVETPADEMARRTQASFGYEWTHFNDWRPSGETNFSDYFKGVDLPGLRGKVVLDAGCGMGRHARQIAPFAGQVVAVDFSLAIEQAARNAGSLPNVDCVQADLLALPLADESCDFVYSLGVLHHLDATERALQQLAAKVRSGGRLRIYLYWKLHGWRGRLLSLATLARRVTTRLPFGVLRVWCWLLSVVLYGTVIAFYKLAVAFGSNAFHTWPLFVYSKYGFNVLYNDQFDRFSAPIEKRYDPLEVKALLESVGLRQVTVESCFGWIGEGRKP